jgi:hypothetical protein
MNTSERTLKQLKERRGEKIDELAAEVKSKGRKEALAKFRLMSGHECLAHHLHKIGIYQTSRYVLCNNPDNVMDSEHLLHCSTLNHEAPQTKGLVSLYWEAREKNDLLISFCH